MPSGKDGTLVNEGTTVRFDFGKIASRYDTWYQTPRGTMYDRLEKRAIDSLLPAASDGGKLLEIGCGTGHFSEHFASKGFEVTGVDISEPMVAVARQQNIRSGEFHVGDAERLPFTDGTFDVVAAITVLEFVCDPVSVVSEMVRCVQSGQYVRFSESVFSERFDGPAQAVWRSDDPGGRICAPKVCVHLVVTVV